MAQLLIQRPTGTRDVVPSQMYKWNTVEGLVKSHAEAYGFKEIRIPTFESTALYVRSVGDTTDVVQKEMYTVSAAGDEDFTLRPEGTAGTVRAIIQNGLLNEGLPQKLFYILSCFRHEKAQANRYREFHQFGVEMAGTKDPRADAEVISLARGILDAAGLEQVKLYINSIGCPTCRAKFQSALREYFGQHLDKLCDTCKGRLERNPMRILDCKSEICSSIAAEAPIILDYLCEECSEHFDKLKSYLDAMDIKYEVNPHIVRGLDYYTKTVFEFVAEGIGAQSTVCGGGRYDGLIETLSDKPCPALGFGMGLERLITTMESLNVEFAQEETCDIYVGSMGDDASVKAMQICRALRADGVRAECDVVGRSVRAQMKYADKVKAKFSVIIGGNELEAGVAKLRNMVSGEETDIPLDDRFGQVFNAMLIAQQLSGEEFEGLELLK
ncbi:histidyl-tRNA synthetase [Ruminococcus sp. YE71]|uniref:histidine--tRNA ligase n=1 Tax=unclassified Ruminococcus TaxID=2608920 RepID=UPI0008908514|nr:MULTISPECIES: histidine--tRNA ligase [unclassified Ruminococcus]SDA12255.1 histidyl-tRNA synthetase [Ruminococcus sp. YE78]SFW16640.1 histidyl-tRNA synthetase [Ruminococcus sp. YE71]